MESLKDICSRIKLQKGSRRSCFSNRRKKRVFPADKEIRKLTETENRQRAREDLRNPWEKIPGG